MQCFIGQSSQEDKASEMQKDENHSQAPKLLETDMKSPKLPEYSHLPPDPSENEKKNGKFSEQTNKLISTYMYYICISYLVRRMEENFQNT